MTDSQLKPGFTSPPVCPQGCARWDNLAADGNTQNQAYVNAKWSGGAPPPGAGNMCAMPGNDNVKADGPWCYCAGTNNEDWGYCQERNAGAETCKKTPNSLNKINTELNDCTSTTELKRNTSFATTTFKIQKDIETLRGIIGDTMSMGDTMFGQFSYGDIMKQVKARNTELKSKKDILVKDVEKKEAIIQRTDRDFSDVNDSIPKPMPKKVLHFVEDYTLAILAISYLFMILSVIYVYTATAELKLIAFGKIFIGSGFLTLFLFMLLFYLA